MAKKKKEAITKNTTNDGKFCAILSYLLIGIIWYFADEKMKKNEFAKFHAKQALVLFILDIIYVIILGVIFMPVVLLSLGFLGPVLYLLYYLPWILVVIGMLNALNGNQKPLPIIGKYAEQFNL